MRLINVGYQNIARIGSLKYFLYQVDKYSKKVCILIAAKVKIAPFTGPQINFQPCTYRYKNTRRRTSFEDTYCVSVIASLHSS